MICRIFRHNPVFRVGGDEFVVIVQGRGLKNIDKLIQLIEDTNEENMRNGAVIVAAGKSIFQNDPSVSAVFEQADAAMYENKVRLKMKEEKVMKTGLVMEGGAMRGMFTCGILDVFMENDIIFDGAVGVSAGATFGCNIKSKQPGRAIRYNKKYCTDRRYHSISSLITTGDIYNVDFCYDELPYKLDKWDIDTFSKNPMEFYCVATDIETGEAVYHRCTTGDKEDIVWIQASASMPVVSRPVEIDGKKYLDGGMSDSIPLKFLEGKGYDRIVVIETQPLDYSKRPQQYMPLIRWQYRKYPGLIRCMEKRYLMYNAQKRYIRDREKAGEILVLRPEEPLNISAVEKDPAELERVYLLGRKEAEEKLEAVKAFIE